MDISDSDEEAVDILMRETSILERAFGDFGMQLCGGFVRRVPSRMLIDARDIGLALDTQSSLRLVLCPSSVFSDWSAKTWQATTFHAADANFTMRNGRNGAARLFACRQAVCQSGRRAPAKADSCVSRTDELRDRLLRSR